MVLNCFYSRYDHLAKVLTKVFDERPENVVDIFEDVSRKVKQETFVSSADTIRDEFEPSTEFNLAEIQKPLFDKGAEQDAEMVIVFLFEFTVIALLEYYFYMLLIRYAFQQSYFYIGSGRRNRNPLAKRYGSWIQF